MTAHFIYSVRICRAAFVSFPFALNVFFPYRHGIACGPVGFIKRRMILPMLRIPKAPRYKARAFRVTVRGYEHIPKIRRFKLFSFRREIIFGYCNFVHKLRKIIKLIIKRLRITHRTAAMGLYADTVNFCPGIFCVLHKIIKLIYIIPVRISAGYSRFVYVKRRIRVNRLCKIKMSDYLSVTKSLQHNIVVKRLVEYVPLRNRTLILRHYIIYVLGNPVFQLLITHIRIRLLQRWRQIL